MVVNNNFINEIPEVISKFPLLKTEIRGGIQILTGSIMLYSEEENEPIDFYEVEIHPTVDYPNSFPKVIEIGGKIPKNSDWHVYPNGNLCLTVPLEERLECKKGINLTYFIENHLVGYLFNQTFRKKNGFFYSEYSHGIKGRLEHYLKVLSVSNYDVMLNLLAIVVNGNEPNSHKKCICRSKTKFKKCHRFILRVLSRSARDLIVADYLEIQNILKNQPLK